MQIGIDLGGSHIAVGIISERNTIIAKREMNIARDELIEDMKQYIVDNIKILIGEVMQDAGAPSCTISKIGIATPGRVKDGIIYDMFNLGIDEFNLVEILSNHYGVEVTARNDAKCAALAESQIGSLKDYNDAVFLTLGTGIGGATFIDGKMLEYTKEWGSEYGHMIIKQYGLECKCGNRGCYEQYCSMRAFKEGIIKLLRIRTDISPEELLRVIRDRLNNADPDVELYIEDYIKNLITGFVNIINIVQPEAICLGGSFVFFEHLIFKRLLNKMERMNVVGVKPKILLASLQNDAGMIGAVM